MTVCAVTSLLSVHILKGRFDKSILFTVSAGQEGEAAMVQQLQAKPRRAMQCKSDMLAASCSCTPGAGQEGKAAMNQQAQATAMRAVRPAAVRALQLSTQRRRTTCRTYAYMHVGVLVPAANNFLGGQ